MTPMYENYKERKSYIMKNLILLAIMFCICGCSTGQKVPEEDYVQAQIEDIAQPTKKVVSVTLVGDCTLATDINAPQDESFVSEAKKQGDYTYFLKNVADIFKEDDLTIVNFEGALSERGSRSDKQFAFRGKPEYVEILSSSSVEAATLANNHSLDYGDESFNDTVEILENAGISAFSDGDIEVKEVNGVKVGLVGLYALNEKRTAKFKADMEAVKEAGAELIIVNAHWGEESAKVPNAKQKELAREAIDLGADLVVGHHPHVLQGIEKYNGKYIVYSLGNFCFGGNRNPSDKDAMIFRQTFTLENGQAEEDDNILIVPCSISSVSGRNNYQPTPLEGDEADRVMEKITERTKAIAE